MTSRQTFAGASTDVPWRNTLDVPEGFGDQYARLIGVLFDASVLPLTSIGGTADDITAVVDPDLPPGGLVDGMKFAMTIAADNAGPMTLALNGGSPVALLDASGGAIPAGGLTAGLRLLVEYISGAYRIIGGAASASGRLPVYRRTFTVSGTWTVPQGYADDDVVVIELWGAGGGGSSFPSSGVGGGGGGSYLRLEMRYADLATSYAIAVGAGGVGGANGGNTSVGALATAYGGESGSALTSTAGRGAGIFGPNATAFGDDGLLPMAGGGGGSSGGGGAAGSGGRSVYGGGGGSSTDSGAVGGVSIFGGSGGGPSTSGQAPAGGGGGGAPGARGEVRIRIGG